MHRRASLSVLFFPAAAGLWPAGAFAAEGLNLFPDPAHVVVNVLLFALLIYPTSRFLLRPLVRVLEERERRTAGALQRVDALLGEAAQLRQHLESRLDEARASATAQRAAVMQEVEREERQILTEARDEAGRTLEAARASIAAEVESARAELRSEADGLAREIAARLLGRPL